MLEGSSGATLRNMTNAIASRGAALQVNPASEQISKVAACVDGNEAAARVAYAFSEVIPIYPITPSSPMAELADELAADARPNLFGGVPEIVEMQSEAGAAGALHGALQKGAFATTFTSSQGLLLMVPNMFKIAGELTACAMHVAARTLATHALSIFGDHSDVMHARSTGWAMLSAGSVQEAHDFAAVAHAATMRARVPFLHFFDGFRTSHEVDKITLLQDADLRALIDEDAVLAHRHRGLTPDAPKLRGSSQNPDVFFQAREAANPFYDAVPGIVEDVFAALAARTGRSYGLVDYVGAPDADRVVVLMGSGAGAAEEAVDVMSAAGERVGLLKVRLYRPFPQEQLLRALPATVRSIAVLDRTKEPGATGEPLLLDVIASLHDAMDSEAPPFERAPHVIGGRYGLSSKEFRPAHVKAIFDELALFDAPAGRRPKRRFTVGIHDDVTRLSLDTDDTFCVPEAGRRGAGDVLRPRRRRNRRGQQGVGQDHRRAHRPVRPGLLRLRLEEVGIGHRVAPALRSRADPLDLPHRGRRLRRLPSVRPAREDARPRPRQAGRDLPDQQPIRP